MQKNDIARRAYMVTVLCVGPDKSGQVRTGVKYYFSSTVSPTLFKFGPLPKPACSFLTVPPLETLRPSEMVESGLRHASVGVGCELVWSATFLRRTTTSERSLESYRLAELKYAFFRRAGHKTKKLPRSLFLWTVLKHGLLEGSTILLQYSAIISTPLESSRLGKLKYAVSAG